MKMPMCIVCIITSFVNVLVPGNDAGSIFSLSPFHFRVHAQITTRINEEGT